MHRNHDFEDDEGGQFNHRFPRAGYKNYDAARGFENQKREPEMAENAERTAGAAAVRADFRFDFCFENIQVFVDAAGGHAAEFAVNQRKVGKYRQEQSQQHHAKRKEPGVTFHASPSLRRIFCSIRFICPWSVS